MGGQLRQFVYERANERCEYCLLRQRDQSAIPFHVEHVIPRQHGGDDDASNLALACRRCNLRKGTNLVGLDEVTGEMIPIFNPRTQSWGDHFAFDDVHVIGRTQVGRVTIRILAMNATERLEIRQRLRLLNLFPPTDGQVQLSSERKSRRPDMML